MMGIAFETSMQTEAPDIRQKAWRFIRAMGSGKKNPEKRQRLGEWIDRRGTLLMLARRLDRRLEPMKALHATSARRAILKRLRGRADAARQSARFDGPDRGEAFNRSRFRWLAGPRRCGGASTRLDASGL
ncbi:hypothetical protein VARIO8X_160002 [Burkholderiales bacterium 8X]|nr:hypothetical protein VARIO8X_160002 [Burkholderiales bacterium 8X]